MNRHALGRLLAALLLVGSPSARAQTATDISRTVTDTARRHAALIDDEADSRLVEAARRRGAPLRVTRTLHATGHPGSLPGPHVTALCRFRGELWVGTFNHGAARLIQDDADPARDVFNPWRGSPRFVNALLGTSERLYVGTNEGLFISKDGRSFERSDFVLGAVGGLAFDGVSVWAATSGALYRVKESRGPRSDVWWSPGGSRSLQKLGAAPGVVWLGSEDRGAIRLDTSARLVARDKPFEVFDLSTSGPSSWVLEAIGLGRGRAVVVTLNQGAWLVDARGTARSLGELPHAWGWTARPVGDRLFFGTQGGAAALSERGVEHVEGLPDPKVHVFLEDESGGARGVWIGTEGGLAWLPLGGEAASSEEETE